MSKKSRDAVEFDQMRKLGFNFESSEGEKSLQPDSSGIIGGRRGLQEYGIGGDTTIEDIVGPALTDLLDFQGDGLDSISELEIKLPGSKPRMSKGKALS